MEPKSDAVHLTASAGNAATARKAKKLTPAQSALLSLAASGRFVTFHDALQCGGSGTTLGSLVVAGLLEHIMVDDRREWRITDAGRAVVGAAS